MLELFKNKGLTEKIQDAVDTLNDMFEDTHITGYRIGLMNVIFLEDGRPVFKFTKKQILDEDY